MPFAMKKIRTKNTNIEYPRTGKKSLPAPDFMSRKVLETPMEGAMRKLTVTKKYSNTLAVGRDSDSEWERTCAIKRLQTINIQAAISEGTTNTFLLLRWRLNGLCRPPNDTMTI